MSREEMINLLRKIDVCARPTIATEDMGLQYDYATSEGAGTGFGGMGDWPVHLFNPIKPEEWSQIRSAIQRGSLSEQNLKGTELMAFYDGIHTLQPIVLSELFKGLLTLPDSLTQSFYCLYDRGKWYDRLDNPRFFLSEQEVKEAFKREYVFDITPWETMTDDELEEWVDRVQTEMSEFPVYTYTADG